MVILGYVICFALGASTGLLIGRIAPVRLVNKPIFRSTLTRWATSLRCGRRPTSRLLCWSRACQTSANQILMCVGRASRLLAPQSRANSGQRPVPERPATRRASTFPKHVTIASGHMAPIA